MWFHRVNWLRIVLSLIDLLSLNVGLWAAYWLRYDGRIPFGEVRVFYHHAWWAFGAAIAAFYLFGLYNRIWRHASGEAVVALLAAVTTATTVTALALLVTRSPAFHPAMLVALWVVWLTLVGGSRFAWRVAREHFHLSDTNGQAGKARRVLIYGAGEAGAALVRRIDHDSGAGFEIVGLVDDDPAKQGMLIRRYRILGTGAALVRLVRQHQVEKVIIAIPSISGQQMRAIVDRCKAAEVDYNRLPSRLEMMGVRVSLSNLRAVQLSDLLCRDPATFPMDTCGEYLRGRCVLVTGAGGSIGSEICRQVARFNPRKLVLFGRGENRIHVIYQELRGQFPDLPIVPVIGNFAVPGVAETTFREHRPDVVFHAGAHKHVYLMEANVLEAVRNNVFGTKCLIEAAQAAGISRLVLISTDKAIEPSSVMGATKRMCEMMAAAAAANGSLTRMIVVRFGNVLGTDGSVLRIFERQLRDGHPLTITDPEATRYFMSCEEAALLVIEAGKQNHDGGIYLLDMGEPVRIQDLAAELVRLWGGDPDDPGNYGYIGLLPGEKLHEKLTNPWEDLEQVAPHLFRVTGPTHEPGPDVDEALAELEAIASEGDEDDLRQALFEKVAALGPQPSLQHS